MSAAGDLDPLLPVLVFIQAHLDEDLALERLAEVAGLSKHHFHRLFGQRVGETVRAYVERLRVERAAFLLGAQDRSMLDIALETGFQGPEVFSRAFRRRMGSTPSAYRHRWRSLAERHPRLSPGVEEQVAGFELSETRVRRLLPMWVAFMRHVGPYEDVPVRRFDDVGSYVRRRGRDGAFLLVAVGHDAPSVTAAEKLRFDACVRVTEPFSSRGRVGCQELPGGTFAVTTFVGPLARLPEAYGVIVGRIVRMKQVASIGLPVVEVFHQTRVAGAGLHSIDLCLAVEARDAVNRDYEGPRET